MAKCHVVGQNLTSDLYVMPKWQAAPSVTGIIFLSRVVGLHLWYGLSFSSVRGCDSPHAFWGNWLENLENFSVLKEFTQNTQKIWDFITTDQILCTICLWIPLGVSDVLVFWLLFVSSQDTWISCSDNAYSILVLECTTTWLQSTGASQLPEEAALEVNGFGEAPFGALWRDLNEIEVPDSVPMICCIYPYVCLVGRFWDALKRISSSAGICLLVFEAFFCTGGCSKLIDVEKDPFAAVRQYQCFNQYVILTLAFGFLSPWRSPRVHGSGVYTNIRIKLLSFWILCGVISYVKSWG